MKLSLRTSRSKLLVLVALGAVSALAACSSSDDDDAAPVEPPPTVEGGTVPPAPEAGTDADAGAADADAEAQAPRVCSDDGFCHTVVPTGQTLRGVWADGQGVAWAVSEQGAILRHDGKAWTLHTKLKGGLYAVWGSGPNDVWVGGDGGLQHGQGTSSASLTFTDANAPGDVRAPIVSIWGTGAKDVWAAGSFMDFPYVGRVLHYTDGFAGAGWQVDGVSGNPILFARVWGSATSGVWVTGRRNNPVTFNSEVAVMRRAVGASKFAEVTIPGDPAAPKGSGQVDKLFDAAAALDGTMWILGRTNTSKPGFLRGTSTDGVTFTWGFVQHGPSVGPVSNFVWGKGANDQWIGGEYGRLRHWDGTTWTQAETTITKYPDTTLLHAMWGDASGELWVVGEGIAMHRAKKN